MRTRKWLFFLALFFPASELLADWGSGATIKPGWQRFQQAVRDAAVHPATWAPALAGVAVYASGKDEDWAERLYTRNPVFGSRQKANKSSDGGRATAEAMWVVSILLTDSGNAPIENKAKGALVQWSATEGNRLVSNTLKKAVNRKEPAKSPDEAENQAFPSNHATGAFSHATLIRKNMSATRLSEPLAHTYVATGYVAATISAWGRIEAGAHHLSDQLLGAALGNFVTSVINDTFMGDSALRLGHHSSGAYTLSASMQF